MMQILQNDINTAPMVAGKPGLVFTAPVASADKQTETPLESDSLTASSAMGNLGEALIPAERAAASRSFHLQTSRRLPAANPGDSAGPR